MSIDSQIEPPQSFMAMYITPGLARPNASQEVILARYELCEDMACVLIENAQTLAFQENFSESEVLTRCYQGLSVGASAFNDSEAQWVTNRLAELLGWEPLDFCTSERQ